MGLKSEGSSSASRTAFASSSPPSPPLENTSERANFAPRSSHAFFTASSSASVSWGKRLIATTTGRLYFFMFSICFSRLGRPLMSASTFSLETSVLGTPPLYLRARQVATRTTASGLRLPIRHLMSRNFSAPRSAPKPASVTT